MKKEYRRLYSFYVYSSEHRKRIVLRKVSVLAYDLKNAKKIAKEKYWLSKQCSLKPKVNYVGLKTT